MRTEWGDVIAALHIRCDPDGDDSDSVVVQLGLSAGQPIFANDREIGSSEPDLFVFPRGLPVPAGIGCLEAEVGPVQAIVDYRVIVSDSVGNLVADRFDLRRDGDGANFWILPPGDYTVTLEQSIIAGEWALLDEQIFSIIPCPVLDVSVTTDTGITGMTDQAIEIFTGVIGDEVDDWSMEGRTTTGSSDGTRGTHRTAEATAGRSAPSATSLHRPRWATARLRFS